MSEDIQLSPEQEKALRLMLSGKNVFLTGEAGTGKSTILREFRERCTRECVFLAPTGIAAINVGGATLHSFFLLKPGLMTPDSIEEVGSKSHRALIRKVKTIVIDEVSMVRSDIFAAIDFRLRSLARGGSQQKPFGGKQLILVGDFFQLPPVVKTETEDSYLNHELGGYYAFQTALWRQANFHNIFLKTVHRQQNDNLFLLILNHIRHGELESPDIHLDGSTDGMNVLEALTKLCANQPPLEPEPVYLCTTNREAQTLNMVQKSLLTGENFIFRAVVTGKFQERDYPTSPLLELKIGARVMVLNNKRTPDGEFEYVNGEVGVVEGITQTSTPAVQVFLDNGKHVSIQPTQWTNMEYELETDRISGKEVIRQKEVGTFVQLPLKLAYAITVHKSQGLSLERVALKLGSGCFSHGQLYTALSRCRSIRNLRIDRRLYAEDVILDPAVIDFYRQLEKPEPERKEITLTIPKEHEAAVMALLAQLQGKTLPSAKAPALPEFPLFSASVEEEQRITSHSDIDKLLIVYRNQTGEERSDGKTNRKNGTGFNKADAPTLSGLAEQYLSNGFLTQSELKEVGRRIAKYKKQWEPMTEDRQDYLF
ncbi:ATP-dependent RecD-like DNA helicase [Victivallis sp. Marseille-Q1083]|uniref:ATP-dependent DNA helicase n=1 Tax=Victivallis sp. Marseille-Q1083 TaxID=2717288 RepID=UPI0015887AA6|nr:PIF1 family ATP-dependent DNA helicase [Victivallis sp. Marseille-Q1083]